MAGIKGYRPSKHTQKLHRERLEAAQSRKPSYNGKGEAEVVPGYQLAQVLQAWTVSFLREHPPGRDFSGPVQVLAERTGIHIRRVSGVCNGEFHSISLTEAEKLLGAIGREEMLSTGEIQVVQNANWSLERWMSYMSERGCI